MERIVKAGQGWRLGWNPQAIEFKGLVGGDNWAIELTEVELQDFCRLVMQLAETMNQMATELMDEEKIVCEVESEWLWLEAKGYPQSYSLHLIVQTGRRAEGEWTIAAVPELLQATQTLTTF